MDLAGGETGVSPLGFELVDAGVALGVFPILSVILPICISIGFMRIDMFPIVMGDIEGIGELEGTGDIGGMGDIDGIGDIVRSSGAGEATCCVERG